MGIESFGREGDSGEWGPRSREDVPTVTEGEFADILERASKPNEFIGSREMGFNPDTEIYHEIYERLPEDKKKRIGLHEFVAAAYALEMRK